MKVFQNPTKYEIQIKVLIHSKEKLYAMLDDCRHCYERKRLT